MPIAERLVAVLDTPSVSRSDTEHEIGPECGDDGYEYLPGKGPP